MTTVVETLIPQKLSEAVAANDIGNVVFNDPLGDEARKAKRNLVAGSFVALVVAVFELQVKSFAAVDVGALKPPLVQGMACVVVLYFFFGYAEKLFTDYSAWKFERERCLVRPYLDLLLWLERYLHGWHEKFDNTLAGMEEHVKKNPAMNLEDHFQTICMRVNSIREGHARLHQELTPLLHSWGDNVGRVERRLSLRYIVRYGGFALLDVFVPLALGVTAVAKTADGLGAFVVRLLS